MDDSAVETVLVEFDVIDLIVPNIHNYFHFIAEFVTKSASGAIFVRSFACRLVLSFHAFVEKRLAPNARLLLPNRNKHPYAWDIVMMLQLNFSEPPVELDLVLRRRKSV